MLGPLYSLGRILATAGFVSSILMSILMVIPGPFQIYERTAVSRRRTLSSIRSYCTKLERYVLKKICLRVVARVSIASLEYAYSLVASERRRLERITSYMYELVCLLSISFFNLN